MSTLPYDDRPYVSLRDQLSHLRQVVPNVAEALMFLRSLPPHIDPVLVDYLNGFCRNWGHHLVSQGAWRTRRRWSEEYGVSLYDDFASNNILTTPRKNASTSTRLDLTRTLLNTPPFVEFGLTLTDLYILWKPGYSIDIPVMKRTPRQRHNAKTLSFLNDETVGLLQHDLARNTSRNAERVASLIRQGNALRRDPS